jgi:hypothetical protein
VANETYSLVLIQATPVTASGVGRQRTITYSN